MQNFMFSDINEETGEKKSKDTIATIGRDTHNWARSHTMVFFILVIFSTACLKGEIYIAIPVFYISCNLIFGIANPIKISNYKNELQTIYQSLKNDYSGINECLDEQN